MNADISYVPMNSEWRPFASPELPAPVAPVVWLPHRDLATLVVTADFGDNDDDRDFSLNGIAVRAHVHLDAADRQIVVLAGDACHITMIVEGALVTSNSVRLEFSAIAIRSLERHIGALQTLLHILRQRKLVGPSFRPGPVDAKHYRNAIIAIDGERAGATRREIAGVIYGNDEVAGDWGQSDRLKAMVKRDVLRGRRLLAGGWRQLVAGGTNMQGA